MPTNPYTGLWATSPAPDQNPYANLWQDALLTGSQLDVEAEKRRKAAMNRAIYPPDEQVIPMAGEPRPTTGAFDPAVLPGEYAGVQENAPYFRRDTAHTYPILPNLPRPTVSASPISPLRRAIRRTAGVTDIPSTELQGTPRVVLPPEPTSGLSRDLEIDPSAGLEGGPAGQWRYIGPRDTGSPIQTRENPDGTISYRRAPPAQPALPEDNGETYGVHGGGANAYTYWETPDGKAKLRQDPTTGEWTDGVLVTKRPPSRGEIDAALLTGSPLDLALQNEARRRKRQQLAEGWKNGDLGRTPEPDTSAAAIMQEGLGMFGASAMENMANVPRGLEQALAAPGNALRKRAGLPLQPLASESGAPAALLGAVDENYDAHRQGFATAAQDLPAPISAGLYLGTELTGQAVEPHNIAAGGILRTPRPAARLLDNLAADLPSAPRAGDEMAGLGLFDRSGITPDPGNYGPLSHAEEAALAARREAEAGARRSTDSLPALRGMPRSPGALPDTGTPPASGLVVAGVGKDGRVYYGQPGDLHFHLPERYPDQAPWQNIGGFAGPDGQLLTREQALAAAQDSGLGVRPAENMGAQLDAMDLNDAARRQPKDVQGSPGITRNIAPGQAGYIRNPWAPEPDLYKQTYNIRHDFVTEQSVAVRQSGTRASALQAAIPDRAAREDMTAVFHGTGNPLVKGDTAQAAASRLAASPYGQTADQAIAAWRQRSDELWTMAREAGADDLGYFRNYLHQVYDAPKGEQAIRGSAFSEGPTTSVMRERTFGNPAQAMALGFKPKSLDFSVLMHETERAHAHTRTILGLMDDIGAVNEKVATAGLASGHELPTPIVRAAVNPNPAQYVRVEGFPILDRAAPGRVDPEAVQMAKKLAGEAGQANAAVQAQRFQPMLPGLEDMAQQPMTAPGIPETPPNIYVHKDVWRNLMPVLKSDDPVALDRLLSTVKRVNFLGSLFHGLSLTEAAMKDMGPIRGLYEGGRRGFGVPGLSQMAAKLGSGKVAEDSILSAIRDGVNVDMPKLDTMSGTFEGMLRDVEGKLRTGGNPLAPRNAMASALSGLRHTSAYYDEALWANYHAPLKVTAHELNLAYVAKKMKVTVADLPREVRQTIAQHTNNAFGGQNWQLLHNQLLSDPEAQAWMRRVFLSPDWNVSAIQTGLSPFSADPVTRMLGRKYWKNAVGLLSGYAALNFAISGHPMWKNEAGHRFDLETGMHETNEDGTPGRKIFYQVGKHARETPEFLFGRGSEAPVVGFALRKLNSPLRAAITATTGYAPTGFPGVLAQERELADKEARKLTPAEDTMARVRDLAGGFLPFVAQRPSELGRKLVTPFVETKGMSLHEGTDQIASIMRKMSPIQTGAPLSPEQSAGVAKIREVRQWLSENGYSGEQINRAVSGARRGIAMERKRKGTPAPPMPDGEIDAPPSLDSNPYDGLWR